MGLYYIYKKYSTERMRSMRPITEAQITALAPNPAAAQNGKKISQKGGFVRLEASADDTFFLGECTGSGSKNYITSADFLDPAQPVFRCTCPSRQIPCKHSLALLYEMMSGKSFAKFQRTSSKGARKRRLAPPRLPPWFRRRTRPPRPLPKPARPPARRSCKSSWRGWSWPKSWSRT